MVKKIFFTLWATFFGLGFFPKMPGTAGSLGGLLIYYLARDLTTLPYLALIFCVSMFALWISEVYGQMTGKKDDQRIVIDEVAGQLIPFLVVPYHIYYIVIGFVLFRIFDMTKIFPANWAQDNLEGGLGVTLDDLIAGIQAAVILYVLHVFWLKDVLFIS